MQEFLAAFHVSNVIPHEQQLQVMSKTFWDSMYNFMRMMYVGISGINSETFQGQRNVFTTDPAKLDHEDYAIKYMGGRQVLKSFFYLLYYNVIVLKC